MREVGDEGVWRWEVGRSAKGTGISCKENAWEADKLRRNDVFFMIVANIEGFGGRNIPRGEGFGEFFEEDGSWLGLAMLVRKEGEIVFEWEREELFEDERGVELGVGDKGEGEVLRETGGSGHGPDGIGEELVVEGEAREFWGF